MYEGNRVLCRDCKLQKNGHCSVVGLQVNENNNVCQEFQHRIKNPSSPPFDFGQYLEWLGSDYYRPYTIDEDKIIGSAKLGEVHIDGGKLHRLLPSVYSPFYETVDRPFCRLSFPRCVVRVDNHNFEVDYLQFRSGSFLDGNKIKFVRHYWKDKPTQRKYHSETYGEYEIKQG